MKLFHLTTLSLAMSLVASAAIAEGPLYENDVPSYKSKRTVTSDSTQAPKAPAAGQLSRAQVMAEAAEARRLGLVMRGKNDYPLPAPTAEQAELIRLAGLRAVQSANAVAQSGKLDATAN
jgi:hypothetical protein